MVLISHRYKFIYIQTRKTASSSVAAFFERYCLPSEKEESHEPECGSGLYILESGIIGTRHTDVKFLNYKCDRCLTFTIYNSENLNINKNIKYTHNCIVPLDDIPLVYNENGKRILPSGYKNIQIFNSLHTSLNKLISIRQFNLTKDMIKNYYKFTIVRNPWDVQVSFFFYMIKKQNVNEDGIYNSKSVYDYYSPETQKIEECSFDELIRTRCVVNSDVYSIDYEHLDEYDLAERGGEASRGDGGPQGEIIMKPPVEIPMGTPGCNFYIRYENLEEDIKKVCETLNLTYDISNLQQFRKNSFRVRDYRTMYTDELRDIVAQKCAVEIAMFGYTF
jgi:hypothetical protein